MTTRSRVPVLPLDPLWPAADHWRSDGAGRDVLLEERLPAFAHDVGFHREVFGQTELIDLARGRLVAVLDALPELAIVETGERRAILLTLVLEDGENLEPQLFLGKRHEHVRLRDRPLLPGAPVVPHFRRLARILRQCRVDGFLAHAMRAVRVGQVPG